MLPNYQARSPFVLKHTTSIQLCMYRWYVCPLNTHASNLFFSKKHGFLGLTPVYYETTALSKPYFILKLRSVRNFLRKRLLFKKQKFDSTGYYAIEDPFPDLISKLLRFMGDTECRLLVVKSHWQSEWRSINAKEATTSRGKLR